MIQVKRARAWEGLPPVSGLLAGLPSSLTRLGALVASWRDPGEGEEEDLAGTTDPEMVAAMQYLASLLAVEPGTTK